MQRKLLALVIAASGCGALPVAAQPAPEVTLTRLDCGNGFNDQRRFSDTFAYTEPKVPFTFSCYVIKHGDDYMVWDTGYLPGSNPNAPTVSLADQLGQLKIRPEQVKYVGISHFHADHTGQLGALPGATLLIGDREWAALTAPKPMAGANVDAFKPWISGGAKVEPQAADKDVFGDGTVTILRTPGHTPGHQALLVRLKDKGPVILVGDAAHFHENYQNNGVPSFNYDRAETLASLERLKQIEKNLKATVIIQHDPRDIGKLPAFPVAAR
ncbi:MULTISPECIES: N-acyl homoserine lactonase family protein [Ramlibacter]|uniref:MBL fold metallo-hydrolase n=1 Tax=Ramlibacter pinisoli TaxID=2682844 RepID=A0A6N8IU18_9BURK|nr:MULTISPECIES: N-acyl homoserine lactonase family protein [Ramlibacter]MBA2965455.1 N-acyl homoserine lactonase family protein [Ramlibacter sp. CGMCC 1.13660]MVQ30421.1 MBL fold metallo-hydrolase [Ramlibacter pinisoli]